MEEFHPFPLIKMFLKINHVTSKQSVYFSLLSGYKLLLFPPSSRAAAYKNIAAYLRPETECRFIYLFSFRTKKSSSSQGVILRSVGLPETNNFFCLPINVKWSGSNKKCDVRIVAKNATRLVRFPFRPKIARFVRLFISPSAAASYANP